MIPSKASHSRAAVLAAALLATCAAAQAQVTGNIDTSAAYSPTNQSADGLTYFNAPVLGGFPSGALTVGEFDFSLPTGFGVGGASFSGDFGSNTLGSGTAPVELFINQVQVATCDAACAAATQSNDVAWNYTFTASQLSALTGGKVVLTAVQLAPSQVVLDPTQVSISTAPVPEPAANLLMLLGLLPVVAAAARRRA